MVRRTSLRALSSAVLFALLLTALHPQPAWAEEGTPPPADPTATEIAPPQDAGVDPAVPAVDPAAVPSAPAADAASVPTEVPSEAIVDASGDPAVELAPAPADLLAQVPEGTTVAVVDAQGVVVPLVSEQAAEIVASGDPIWCPASVSTTTPGLGGCTTSYTTFTELIDYLANDLYEPSVDGIIWFAHDYDSAAEAPFVLDGSGNFLTMGNYKLTLRGGWDDTPGSKAIVAGDPSEFNTNLSIVNWNAAVTLTDILITTVPGPNEALDIGTSGKVTLNHVRVNANGVGAHVDNSAAVADVVVAASEFSDNTLGSGLVVLTNGAITLTSVLASRNGGDGAVLDITGPLGTARDVVLAAGLFEFNENAGSGLRAYTRGMIHLLDVTATGNGIYGAELNNWLGYDAGMILAGTNIFSENGDDGLYAWSCGAITANNLVGNANGDWGARLENSDAPRALPVTLTGSNEFKFSGGGLGVRSNGTISVSNVTANSNDTWEGILLENDMPGFAGDVKVTGYLTANDNHGDGLAITSNGAMTLSNVTANNNGFGAPDGIGVYLDNSSAPSPKGITLSGANTTFFNNAFNNAGGLVAHSKGAITINNLRAILNQNGGGAVLDNTWSTSAAPQKITLTGESVFERNGGDGIDVSSFGAITVANLTASANAGDGAVIDNYRSGSAVKPMGVTLSGNNYFGSNSGSGLEVTSLGSILISNLNANSNGDVGALLENGWSGALGAITLTGTSNTSGNGASGLEAYSRGNITLADLDSSENDGYGLYLSNANGNSAGTVTVGTSRAGWCNGLRDNSLSGMELNSFGVVTLSNVCADGNGDPGAPVPYGYGVRVQNSGATSAKAVNLKGSNSFNGNFSGGLLVESRGPIAANNVSADENSTGFGAYLTNTTSGPAAPQNVTLTGSNEFNGNAYDGLDLYSFGGVTLNSVTAQGNYGSAVWVDNFTGAITPKAVTINGYAATNSNFGHGLHVASLGAIKVANLGADENGYGAWLDNSLGSPVGGVTLTGSAYTSGNTNYGLQVTTKGLILVTLTDAWIDGNGGYGWSLDNHTAATPLGITLSASAGNLDFWDNGGYGLLAQSKGPINITPLVSDGNAEYGAHLTNNFTGAVGGITLGGPGSSFNNNGTYGLWVDSRGVIYGGQLDASGNGAVGALLSNEASGPGSPKSVTLYGDIVNNNFNNNADTGLVVYSYGAIEMNFIDASDNGQGSTSGYGAILDNYLVGHPLGAATTPKPITIIGYGSFSGNLEGGLSIVSLGAIRAAWLAASSNGGDAVYLNNQWGQPSPGGVTLTGSSWFDMNEGTGLVVFSHGAITLSNIDANRNGDDGAYLDTYGLTAPQKVTLTGTNNFDENGVLHPGNGLEVWADGGITISNLTARWNSDNGAYLDTADHYAGLGIPSIRLTGSNVLSHNFHDGLAFDAQGMVYLYNLTADANLDDGIQGAATGEIYVCHASLTNNADTGWYLGAYYVTLQGVFSFGNSVMNGFLDGPGTLAIVRSCP